ncbi:MAG: putative Ig domain-containing protein [Desulfuromusa sp.]|jgi:hypothetical protein|nr:putative Ig domain-containing protein [Desulfuromusa sp.]
MKKLITIKFILLILSSVVFSTHVWGKTVTLSWDASPSTVTGYKVHYDTESSASLLGTGADEGNSPITVGNVLTYVIHGLPDDSDHYFAVTAYDSTDNESVYSNLVHSPIVSNSNTPPVLASIGNKTVLEGATLTFTLSATDADGDSLTYAVNNLPDGAGFNNSTGAFSWSPEFDQSQIYAVTFSVSDGSDTDTETINITVSDINQAPILNTIGTKTIGEGFPLAFTVSANDLDNDALSYSAEGLPEGAEFDSTTRSFNWTPEVMASSNARVYPVIFIVSDGAADDSELVTINVTNVNQAPVLTPVGATSITEGDIYNLIIEAVDPDNDALTYTASGLPEGSVFTPSTRSFSWIPGNDQSGSYQVTFNVSDGFLSDSETVPFTVNNGNEAPILDAIGAKSIAENSLLSFVISANDINGDSLSYSASGLPPGAVFDAAQQRFSWTPDYTQAGNFTVVFSVTDELFIDSETVEITVTNYNRTPVISGTPGGATMATTSYSFTPIASDPDGDPLTFSIVNKPNWASFSSSTGELSGTATADQVGTSSNIIISVSDSIGSTSLSPFSIDVIAYVQQDSDGDGVLDHLDAFPDDINEWVDTDGDQIGNNSDLDDDNDGIADIRDGFPLDSTKSGWIISATAGTGGYLTPEGNTSVLYGGSQGYQLTPMAGYYIHDLLVDNVSVGLVENYVFENIGDHHSITAVFAPIPTGLSQNPISSGLIGVERVDGGDDSSNLVDGKPKQDLDYRFRVVFRDSVAADQRKVFLILDNYKYEMQNAGGALTSGADYTFTTRLGASFSHRFYFTVEDASGTQLWRYPGSGDFPGPAVSLLDGKNVVGIAAKINAYALDAIEAFNEKLVYRWDPEAGPKGQFELVGFGAPVASGEGYVLKRSTDTTLPDLSIYGTITDSTYEFQVKPGWNIISNPYGGNISLSDIEVRSGDDAPVSWLLAAENNLVVDVIYSYLGKDWGNTNEFSSATGTKPAVLIPWIGYWIYINQTDQPVSLLIQKPLQ